MSDQSPNFALSKNSALVLANAAALGSSVVRSIMGNDISSAINGVTASRDMIEGIILQRLTKLKQ